MPPQTRRLLQIPGKLSCVGKSRIDGRGTIPSDGQTQGAREAAHQ
jgi:hypothetical protein